MRALLLHALVAALLAAAGIAAYDRWVLRPTLVVGVVDLSEVYRAKEAEFTQMLTSTGTEAEREVRRRMAHVIGTFQRKSAQPVAVDFTNMPSQVINEAAHGNE